MPEMYLPIFTRVYMPGFTFRTCGPFTKNKERILKFREAGDSRYIYQNELDKASFSPEELLPVKYSMAKHLILLKIQGMMGMTVDLLQSFTIFLKKSLLLTLQEELLKAKLCQTNN